MKKFAFLVFISAIVIGSIASTYSNFGKLSINQAFPSVNGSGIRKTEMRNVGNFDKIEVSGAIVVKISAGQDFGISVEADDNILQSVKTEVENGILKIYADGSFRRRNSVNVTVTMPQISSLNVEGASKAALENVETAELNVSANGASKIGISGKAARLTLEASGASSINAVNIESGEADAKASGASKVSVFANDKLTADANGASRISYIGNPLNIEKSVSGASLVFQQ